MSLKKTRRKVEVEDISKALEDEETALDLMYLRIKAPIVWEEWPPHYKIQDMRENYYEDAISLIKSSHMRNETTCRSIRLYDEPESVEGYADYLRAILKDSCSIMAFSEETQELVGILVMRVTNKSDFGKVYSRVKINHGAKFNTVLDLQRHINKTVDVFEHMKTDVYLRIYLLDVKEEDELHDVSFGLMKGGYRAIRSMGIPIAMGLFSSAKMQELATIFGMQIVDEVYFVDWRDGEGTHANMIFDDPGIGNYTMAVMAGPVPPPKNSKLDLL